MKVLLQWMVLGQLEGSWMLRLPEMRLEERLEGAQQEARQGALQKLWGLQLSVLPPKEEHLDYRIQH
jgi:hypothetical protein